jgi:hypothetical protein
MSTGYLVYNRAKQERFSPDEDRRHRWPTSTEANILADVLLGRWYGDAVVSIHDGDNIPDDIRDMTNIYQDAKEEFCRLL